MKYDPLDNWRNDPDLQSVTEYRKKFAIWPIICGDGTRLWFKNYYKKYEHWGHRDIGTRNILDEHYLHTDFIENVSESEYIVRKLSGNL
jgi:hypothetical protein